MPTVVFVQSDGTRRAVETAAGLSVMEAARGHGVPGILAQCGGACACATCHVYVDPSWLNKLEPAQEMELGMLESACEPRLNSRLSCQLQLTVALDGLQVVVPDRQCTG